MDISAWVASTAFRKTSICVTVGSLSCCVLSSAYADTVNKKTLANSIITKRFIYVICFYPL